MKTVMLSALRQFGLPFYIFLISTSPDAVVWAQDWSASSESERGELASGASAQSVCSARRILPTPPRTGLSFSARQICAALGVPLDLKAQAIELTAAPKNRDGEFQSPGKLWDPKKLGDVSRDAGEALSRHEEWIFAAAKMGTPRKWREQFEQVRSILRKRVNSHSHLDPRVSGHILRRLDSTRLVTFESAQAETDPQIRLIQLALLFEGCGNKIDAQTTAYRNWESEALRAALRRSGLKTAASGNIPDSFSAVLLCPAAVGLVPTSVAQVQRDSALRMVLAHELGHAMAEPQGVYSEYLSCLSEQYGAKIPSLAELRKRRILADVLPMEMLELDAALQNAEQKAVSKKWSPSGVASHANELIADYWAQQWVQDQLHSPAVQNQEGFLAGIALRQCLLTHKSQTTDFESGEDGEHPSSDVRLDLLFRNAVMVIPAARKRLALPDSDPVCRF